MASVNQNDAKRETPSTSSTRTKSKATNPFFVFLHEFRQKLAERGMTNLSVRETACMAGERWRQMSPSEKLSYIVWARKNQQQQDTKLKVEDNNKEERYRRYPMKTTKRLKPKQKSLTRNNPNYIN